jgi:hypothetical protein
VMEAAVTLALLLRRFDLQLAKTPEEIGKNVLSYTRTVFHAHSMCAAHDVFCMYTCVVDVCQQHSAWYTVKS